MNNQLNTWNQYCRWVDRENLAWHPQAQRFVYWANVGETQGAGSAISRHCARIAMKRKMTKFGPAMRRWLAENKIDFPPGWNESRDRWRLDYL